MLQKNVNSLLIIFFAFTAIIYSTRSIAMIVEDDCIKNDTIVYDRGDDIDLSNKELTDENIDAYLSKIAIKTNTGPILLRDVECFLKVNLSNNHLTKLPAILIGKKFMTLNLSNNNFTHIDTSISPESTSLDLSNNQLENIPDNIVILNKLKHLSLRNNSLKNVNSSIGALSNLKSLKLDNNQITELPAEIGNLRNLTHLSLSNNLLTYLPEEIGYLEDLIELDVNNNKLVALPEDISNLKHLIFFFAGHNQLERLPEKITGTNSLSTFDFSHNKLSTIPASIYTVAMRNLFLGNNQIQSLPAASAGSAIKITKVLDLSNNQLVQLPDSFFEYNRAIIINLSYNRLSALPNFSKKQPLYIIRSLDLSHNRLQTLPSSIGNAIYLCKLFLDDNQLKSLPIEITKLTGIERLFLQMNPMQLISLNDRIFYIDPTFVGQTKNEPISKYLSTLLSKGALSIDLEKATYIDSNNIRQGIPKDVAQIIYDYLKDHTL